MMAVAALALLITADPDAEYLSGEPGVSVAEVVQGLAWSEVDARFLPNGIEIASVPVGGREAAGAYQANAFTVRFSNGTELDGFFGDRAAHLGQCLGADEASLPLPYASFCRDWPEFRETVLLLISLGFEEISFSGESQSWPVDLAELNITAQDIQFWADAAAALNPSNEDETHVD